MAKLTQTQKSGLFKAGFRLVSESPAGLAIARERGSEDATKRLLISLDTTGRFYVVLARCHVKEDGTFSFWQPIQSLTPVKKVPA